MKEDCDCPYKNHGGTASGPKHTGGGITYRAASGKLVELEGEEPVIPEDAYNDPTVRTRKGTNDEIIEKILKKVGCKLSDEVRRIRGGDIVICVRSAKDKTKRSYTGTDKQILSAINESGGCKIIEPGAKVKEVKKNGGAVDKTNIWDFLNQQVTFKQLFQ